MHVCTFFDYLIHQLVNQDVRLWVVGIADAAESFITYMETELARDSNSEVGKMVSGMAFMEPSHDATNVKTDAMKNFLHVRGKCWIKSSKPMGTFINAPGAMKPIKMPDVDGEEEDADMTDDEEAFNAMAGSYDYHGNTVSCPTYSAGVDIDEMIWPTVMDQVLDFFQGLAEEENARARRYRSPRA